MLDAVEAIKEKMVLVCKVLQKQRVIDGYGHLTVRLADGRITPTTNKRYFCISTPCVARNKP